MTAAVTRQAAGLLFALAVGVLLPWTLFAQPQDKTAAGVPAPKLTLVLRDRHAQVTPERSPAAHTGGGTIDVAQPRDDTVVITMTGVAVAGPHPCQPSSAALNFELQQCLAIVSSDERLKSGKLTIEATLLGLLRGDKDGGSASVAHGNAAVTVNGAAHLGLTLLGVACDSHVVAGCDNLALNEHKGPASVVLQPGEYALVQSLRIDAAHARSFCGTAAAAEFAPDPVLDPQWISKTDPFRGANKKDLGFRVTVRVEAE